MEQLLPERAVCPGCAIVFLRRKPTRPMPSTCLLLLLLPLGHSLMPRLRLERLQLPKQRVMLRRPLQDKQTRQRDD
jgi:hypothetical protein